MMKLYYRAGACSMATHIVLNELGAAFDLERVDTQAGVTESGTDYKTINSRGYVPALILNNGETLTENAAILQYLFDEYFGDKVDVTILRRARLQEALSFLSSELHAAFRPLFAKRSIPESELQHANTILRKRVGHFEDMIADGREFVLGTAYTPVDAYAFVILNWTTVLDFPLDDWPKVKAFYERVKARPATQKALAQEGLS